MPKANSIIGLQDITDPDISELQKTLSNKKNRLKNLYSIINKEGKKIPFQPTVQQNELYDLLQKKQRIIIIKGRQIGFSTAIGLYMLDDIIWNKNKSFATVADISANSTELFKRNIKKPYDYFSEEFPELLVGSEIVSDNSCNITLENNSCIYTVTRLRSGTYQFLHCSELAIVAAKDPARYEEIIAGAFQTVPENGTIIVETTMMGGKNSPFMELVNVALENKAQNRNDPLDWYLHFVPWYKHDEYVSQTNTEFPPEIKKYFNNIAQRAVNLEENQKQWYYQKKRLLHDKVFNEYPTEISEAFYVNSEGAIYGSEIVNISLKEQICNLTINETIPLYVAMDIGRDTTACIFFQYTKSNNIHIIDFYENKGKHISHYIDIISQRYKNIAEVFVPHDAYNNNAAAIESSYSQISKCFKTGIIPKTQSLWTEIQSSRSYIAQCFFDANKCKDLIEHLRQYSKRYNMALSEYVDEPIHNIHSHAADSFRYMCCAISAGWVSHHFVTNASLYRKIVNKTGPVGL
jgi:hypothetical protein